MALALLKSYALSFACSFLANHISFRKSQGGPSCLMVEMAGVCCISTEEILWFFDSSEQKDSQSLA